MGSIPRSLLFAVDKLSKAQADTSQLAVGSFIFSTATKLKAGNKVYIDLKITGDRIAAFSGYLHFDEEIFSPDFNKNNIIVAEELEEEENGEWEPSFSKKIFAPAILIP